MGGFGRGTSALPSQFQRTQALSVHSADVPTGVGFGDRPRRRPMATARETRSPGQLARETFEALFDRQDIDAVRPFWTENSVDHFLALGIDARGPEQLARFFRELHAAAPDWKMTIENIVEDDRHAVVQWTGTGTFNGAPFQGVEPTGKRVTLRGCDVMRFSEDGTLEENTIYYDGAEWARQVGMLPPRDSAIDKGMTEVFNTVTKLRGRIANR
jgi:steroid delta-isomerase-like uncharacterized protein